MNDRCAAEGLGGEATYKIIRRGWKFGAKDFVERLFEKMNAVPKKENHISTEVNETMEVKGRRIIKEKLEELKLKSDDLVSLPRMDPMKIEIAQLLRAQTTLPLKWIAYELKAGTAGTLAVALYGKKKNN